MDFSNYPCISNAGVAYSFVPVEIENLLSEVLKRLTGISMSWGTINSWGRGKMKKCLSPGVATGCQNILMSAFYNSICRSLEGRHCILWKNIFQIFYCIILTKLWKIVITLPLIASSISLAYFFISWLNLNNNKTAPEDILIWKT